MGPYNSYTSIITTTTFQLQYFIQNGAYPHSLGGGFLDYSGENTRFAYVSIQKIR